MSVSPLLLVANIGSTSFKFRLFEMPAERLVASGGVERIGSGQCPWKASLPGGQAQSGTGDFAGYDDAIGFVERWLGENGLGGFSRLAAVGFKPVMAKDVSGTQLLDERVLGAMEAMNSLFPAHNPPYIAAVRSFRKLHPHLPCIGTFETAFYDHLPAHNRRFPIPLEWEKRYGIRRYGFHGASHRFVSSRAAELLGRQDLRVISCHLGGSSSIACVRDGRAIDSSWGMTAQSGLPQNNRVGDFDVFALLHLIRDVGLEVEEVIRALGSDSGLKGMSGLATGDVRDLLEAKTAGNVDAGVALDVFVGQIRKYVGQFLVEMNGADALIFTAGIAENNPSLREAICEGMEFCGLRLDTAANAAVRAQEACVSTPDSKIQVWVIPTNEEIVIAREAWLKLSQS